MKRNIDYLLLAARIALVVLLIGCVIWAVCGGAR